MVRVKAYCTTCQALTHCTFCNFCTFIGVILSVALSRKIFVNSVSQFASGIVDKYQLSNLIALRSPCQSSLPRNRLICSCFRRRKSVLSPSSTASRFVLSPVNLSVSFINLSSISMLVLIMCTFCHIHTQYSTIRNVMQPMSGI